MNVIQWFLVLLVAKYNAEGARILGIFANTAPSHYILGSALMKGLAEKRHDVTIVTPFKEKNPPKNGSYKEVLLTGHLERAKEKDVNMFNEEAANIFAHYIFLHGLLLDTTEAILQHPNVRKLLTSDQVFDVVIVEQFMNDAFKCFAARFNAPLVLISTIGTNEWISYLFANPSPPSYVRSPFLSYSSEMTFKEKLMNLVFSGFMQVLHRFYVHPKHAELAEKYCKNNLYDVLFNASIVLLNSHPSINQATPYVPNMIDIGGFHVRPPGKLLEDLQKFLDQAKEGVVYFSMGSNLKSAHLPIEKREALLKAFGKLRQKVLWKWDEEVLPGQPENVKLSKWWPQQDVLEHPNVKLFITHGGLLSITETIYHGVPVLAIPVFGDQKFNARNIVDGGYGLSLPYSHITEEALTENMNKLLSDQRYAQNAKKRSELFHDRIVPPLETAIYWVEFVARHKGAPHLRVAAVDMPFYQYYLLDVLLVGMGVVLLVFAAVFKMCKRKSQEKVKKN